MDDIQPTIFDYTDLDTETRSIAQQRANEIRTIARRAATDVIEIGTKLIEVKARLGHGNFGKWIAAEFAWSQDMASRFMSVATKFGQIPQVAEFAPSALYLLASQSVPDAARQVAVIRAEVGEKITVETAKRIIAEHAIAMAPEAMQRIAERAPELLDDIRSGKTTVSQAKQAIARQRQSEPAVTPPLPEQVFRCIVIDPPWPIVKIEREERPNQGTELDYPTMTLEAIAALPVASLAEPTGCHVYLWTTQKYLPDAFALFTTWGVRYQCLMTWVKPSGMTPYSWMYNTEHVLFGRIGSLPLLRMGLKLAFDAPVVRHSQKPDVFYQRVCQASPGPRLDMFARQARDGFAVWGNEVQHG